MTTEFRAVSESIRMKRTDLAAATGVASPAAVLLTLTANAALSPTYAWPAEPFSVLGAPGEPTAALFGAGLVLGGLLALPFAVRLWRTAVAAVGVLYALVGLSFAGAGLFPAGTAAHGVFGAGLFVGIWLLLWAAAVVDWRRDSSSSFDAALAFLLGTAALAVWLPYDLGVRSAQFGYGFAELVAFGAFAVWSVRTALRLRACDPDASADSRPETPNSAEASNSEGTTR